MKDSHAKKERIAITGIGMVSSVGLTALSSAAAVFAGMMNYGRHEKVMVKGDEYGMSLRGATIARVPDSFISSKLSGIDRALALIIPAMKEATIDLPHWMMARVYCYIDQMLDSDNALFLSQLETRMPRLLNIDRKHDEQRLSGLGRCQSFENIIQAVNDLQHWQHQMALIGCADSLCEENVLSKLLEDERLLDGTNPEGIVAGEAGCAVLLETESHARERNAKVLAWVNAWGRAAEPHPWTSAKASTAKGLTDAFRDVFSKTGGAENGIEMVINDMNGERVRALEWSLSQGLVFTPSCKYTLLHPADGLGDCGGAMGLAQVVVAVGAMLMKREPPLLVALSTSDDAEARRVLLLERGENLTFKDILKPDLKVPQ